MGFGIFKEVLSDGTAIAVFATAMLNLAGKVLPFIKKN